MKKSSILVSILLAGMSISLVGCGKKSPYSDKNLVQIDPYQYETTYRSMRISGSGYTAEQYTEHKNAEGKKAFVIEDVRALVIPVDFTDYPASSLPKGEEGTKEQLQKVMFGSESEMPWYSLSRYYEASSFGQCKISGEVHDWYHVDMTAEAFAKAEGGTAGSQTVINRIEEMYHKEYVAAKIVGDEEKMQKYDLTRFDANKDGYVDSVIMIYSAPIQTTGTLFWAFCWSVLGAWGQYSPEREGTNRFFWASYWFFYDKVLDKRTKEGYPYASAELREKIANDEVEMDSHTMIHEYGHVLGMPDYYITDYNKTDFDGMGYLDMMDYNIGDHNAMSKAWYGWINPKYVVGSVKTTLKSTTTTGDTIIIPIQGKYNNTLMDQFIMIEFLTPEGVAYQDGVTRFKDGYPMYYSKAGIRVLHVDARLGSFNYVSSSGKWQFAGFTTSTNTAGDGNSVRTACDNTATDSCFPDYKLIEVLPSTGKSIKSYGASNDDLLYYQGSSFGVAGGAWENYQMHDSAGGKTVPLGFSFTVDKINGNESVELTINKL
ncbi:MAG: hypothetical protein K6F07_00365 [Bacilli bacterium]|nr:hypothetical protein [Bacilli bacterium]